MKVTAVPQKPIVALGRSSRNGCAVSDKTEMLKALAAYSGPIKQCPPGGARGADDLRRWALHRAGGMSGVKARKQARKLAKRMKLHREFKASGASQHTTFQAW